MEMKNLLADLKIQTHDLKDQVVIITGGGQGIGRYAAHAFAAAGAQVVIAETSDAGTRTAEEIVAAGEKAEHVQCDVASPESVAALKEKVMGQYGHVDILVNNAIQMPVVDVLEMDLETWKAVMDVNLNGPFLTVKAFLPIMLEQRKGTIINMVSTDAMPGLSAYVASKQGISGFSQSLAREVSEEGIQVIAFAPGMADTPETREIAEDLAPKLGLQKEQFLKMPLHAAYDGLMPPEHAGAAAVYLAARLAKRYHGKQVNGYEVLEEAGLIRVDKSAEIGEKPKITANADLVMLFKELQKMIDEMGAEFEDLPAFNQPLARSGFKNKTGLGIEDWERISAELVAGVQQGSKPQDIHPRLDKDLINLAAYYRGLPGEMALFSLDDRSMRELRKRSSMRLEVISELLKKVQTV